MRKNISLLCVFLTLVIIGGVFPKDGYAWRCVPGVWNEIFRLEDQSPVCIGHEEIGDDCDYDLVYYEADGPDCVPGLAQTVINPCLIWPWCDPVIGGNLCNFEPEDKYKVTIAYFEAELHTPWDCNMEYCFFNCENAVFYPQCEENSALCPGT